MKHLLSASGASAYYPYGVEPHVPSRVRCPASFAVARWGRGHSVLGAPWHESIGAGLPIGHTMQVLEYVIHKNV